jgi:ABC-type uncharacterized transport system permease subunit
VGALGLYARYARASIKGQMQYPASFVFLTLGQFLSTIVEFIGIAALFSRFQNLGGWTLAQVALFYGTVNISFALADMIARGFDVFGPLFVKTGEFDRLLAQYPIEIYSNWFRQFFTFVVPLSCVAYFPIVAILGIDDPLGWPRWFLYLSPLFGFLFLGISLLTWRLGKRHYASTGS